MRRRIAAAGVTAGFALAGGCSYPGQGLPENMAADTLLVNGHIYTANPDAPWAEAVAIRGNRIEAIGSTDEVLAQSGWHTKTIDLGGRMAMPGIIDTHTHFLQGSELLEGPNVYGAASLAEV